MPFDRPALSLADVVDRLQKKRLPPQRQRDLVSAVRRVAGILGCKPGDLTADVQALSRRLSGLNAAEIGVSKKTWATLRSNFLAAMDASGAVARLAAKTALRSAAWQNLLDGQPKQMRYGLSRLATWCSLEYVEPAGVDEETLQRFEQAVRTQTLARSPEPKLRLVRQLWNNLAAEREHGLKRVAVAEPTKYVRVPWERLPASFRTDVEAHLAWARGDDILAENARLRPLAPRSVHLRRNFIHSAAASLVEAGWSPADIVDLKTLTSPHAFRAALGHRYKQIGKVANDYNASLAKALIAIAREWCAIDAGDLAELKKMLARVPAQRPGLTAKNKRLLRFFDDPAKLDALIRLPTMLWTNAMKREDPVRKLAEAQTALAIGILIFAPLRRSNLADLTLGEHVYLPKAPNGETLVQLPAEMMKTREPFALVLPPSLTRILRAYEVVLAEVVTGPTKLLFVNRDGARRGDAAVAQGVEKELRTRLGVKMTAHQFRHLAAKIMLDADPGAYETLRQLLGHKNLKTTLSYYAELDTKRVSRIHAALIERRLAQTTAKRRPALLEGLDWRRVHAARERAAPAQPG